MAFIILADAYSHFLPGNSALDLAFACSPGAQDPDSSTSSRRASEVALKRPQPTTGTADRGFACPASCAQSRFGRIAEREAW